MDILPDDRAMLSRRMAEIADENQAELILTTGGTGFSPRDVMPEATEDITERKVPGIPEAIRAYSMTITKRAMLSRATAGIRKKTLIINLPGSPKAVKEKSLFGYRPYRLLLRPGYCFWRYEAGWGQHPSLKRPLWYVRKAEWCS